MYQNHLIVLSKDERFHARLPPGDVRARRRNPACGDEIAVAFDLVDGQVRRLRCEVRACAVVRASLTALGNAVEGQALETIRQRLREGRAFFEGESLWAADWGHPDLPALGEVRAFPMRVACARLPWLALEDALKTVPPN